MVRDENSSMETNLPMFIMDVLRYDIEPIESIINLLNDSGCIGWREFWPSDFTLDVVVPALVQLVRQGLVDVYELNGEKNELLPVVPRPNDVRSRVTEYWFLLTQLGMDAWEKWKPPTSQDS